MNTTHIPATNCLKWLTLSLFFLFTACNKNEDLTLVIEDGQPTISTLIVGQWQPTGTGIIDRITGEILEMEEPESGNSAFWEFFEDGTFGRSDEPDERFHWQADQEDFCINIDGHEWYVDWLTRLKLRLRERMDDDRDQFYDFGRIGDFIDNEEEEPTTNESSYEPYEGAQVKKIIESVKAATHQYKKVYTYQYDKLNRIVEFSCGNDENSTSWSWKYKYDKDNVTASLNDLLILRGHLNKDGYIESVEDVEEEKEITWYDYNNNGYLYAGKTMNDYLSVKYDQNWNATEIHYPYIGTDWYYAYEMNEDNLKSNLDLNKVCMSMGNKIDATRTDMDGVFGQFGFLGKRSPSIVDEEANDIMSSAFEHKVVNNQVKQIIRMYGNTIYTYDIYYE